MYDDLYVQNQMQNAHEGKLEDIDPVSYSGRMVDYSWRCEFIV